jgi:hypothetical protein
VRPRSRGSVRKSAHASVDSPVPGANPIGWCQWYLYTDYPEHARDVGAEPGDVGIDYAIGDPNRRRAGVGTELIATLVT